MIVRVRAGWVVPVVGPVLRNGLIDVDAAAGSILALGADPVAMGRTPHRVVDLGEVVVLPGLVNTHTHLELSHLAGRVPRADRFTTWVTTMLAARAMAPDDDAAVRAATVAAIATAEATGTVAVGDIGNTDAAVGPLRASSLSGIHFTEALGFRTEEATAVAARARHAARVAQATFRARAGTRLAAATAPHAPYSSSPALIQALAKGLPESGGVASVHVGESREELELLARGTGPFRELLDRIGKWDQTWEVPRTDPVRYLASLGALHSRLIVVHGTQLGPDHLGVVAAAGATLVLCTRSNRWVGAGVPPVREAFASGVRVAVGTDSLASVEDLNMFAELATLRRDAPEIEARRLLRAATWAGAQALGCTALGYLGPGATSRAVVRVPPSGTADVEEWLVADASDTADLCWLDQLLAQATGDAFGTTTHDLH